MSQSSFVYTQSNGLQKMIRYFFWLTYKTLTSTITMDQSGPRSNSNEEVLHIPQRIGISPSNVLALHPGHSLENGVLHFCRDGVGIFYSSTWLDKLFGVPIDILISCTLQMLELIIVKRNVNYTNYISTFFSF